LSWVIVGWRGGVEGIYVFGEGVRERARRIGDGNGDVENMMGCVAMEGCERRFAALVVGVNDVHM
tara:strand:+ start:13624 stop:13818 length:195 start_codon:yes stop_codon:yes gene_type:complete